MALGLGSGREREIQIRCVWGFRFWAKSLDPILMADFFGALQPKSPALNTIPRLGRGFEGSRDNKLEESVLVLKLRGQQLILRIFLSEQPHPPHLLHCFSGCCPETNLALSWGPRDPSSSSVEFSEGPSEGREQCHLVPSHLSSLSPPGGSPQRFLCFEVVLRLQFNL